MGKEVKILIALILILIFGIIYSERNSTKKIDWFQSYMPDKKTPYGTYIFYNELKEKFPATNFIDLDYSPYEFLSDNNLKGTLIFINEDVDPGTEEIELLEDFVSEGNDVLIASHNINFDSLGVRTRYFSPNFYIDSMDLVLTNPALNKKKYYLNRLRQPFTFQKIDTLNTTKLGEYISINKKGEQEYGINFIKLKHGNGNFFFITVPEVFTNYFILDSLNYTYINGVMSYLGKPKNIIWDNYYKNGSKVDMSPLHYVMSNASLKWAYYFAIIGVLIFMFFESKRRQRVIPVIAPEQNRTLEFSHTIAGLYYEKSNHKSIAEMKIKYFLEYVRNRFMLDTEKLDADFQEKLAEKSGKPINDVKNIIKIINYLNSGHKVDKEKLIEIEKLMDKFKK